MEAPPRLLTSEEEKALGTLVQQWQELVHLKKQLTLEHQLPQQQQHDEKLSSKTGRTQSGSVKRTRKAGSSSSSPSSGAVHIFSSPHGAQRSSLHLPSFGPGPEAAKPLNSEAASPWEAVAAATGLSLWAIQVRVMLGSRAMRMLVAYNTRYEHLWLPEANDAD
jgi:hypothetical protein